MATRSKLQRLSSAALRHNNNTCDEQSCFDPVTDLHGDLAAQCLSFVGFQDLLNHAQLVSRAWRDTIDGGLPAVWHEEVSMKNVTDTQLSEVVRKSHGAIRALKLYGIGRVTTQGLDTIRALSDIRKLNISTHYALNLSWSLMSSFNRLEDLQIHSGLGHNAEVAFPTMQHLKTVRCSFCVLKGFYNVNLPSLTKLSSGRGRVETNEAWPASLRVVSIYRYRSCEPKVMACIAALPHLVELHTDYSFLVESSLTPSALPDELSLLPGLTTLQRTSVSFDTRGNAMLARALFTYLACMTSLRAVRISVWDVDIADKDIQCLSRLANLQDLSIDAALPSTSAFSNACLGSIISPPNLTTLALTCDSFTDYSLVASCNQLRSLHIDNLSHQLSLAEVEAIAQLHQLESLELMVARADATYFSRFCSMRSLASVLIVYSMFMPATGFCSLPSLSSLERLLIHSVQNDDVVKLVDCLVQMPKLRHVEIASRSLSLHEEQRLRDALPRLERLRFSHDVFSFGFS